MCGERKDFRRPPIVYRKFYRESIIKHVSGYPCHDHLPSFGDEWLRDLCMETRFPRFPMGSRCRPYVHHSSYRASVWLPTEVIMLIHVDTRTKRVTVNVSLRPSSIHVGLSNYYSTYGGNRCSNVWRWLFDEFCFSVNIFNQPHLLVSSVSSSLHRMCSRTGHKTAE